MIHTQGKPETQKEAQLTTVNPQMVAGEEVAPNSQFYQQAPAPQPDDARLVGLKRKASEAENMTEMQIRQQVMQPTAEQIQVKRAKT